MRIHTATGGCDVCARTFKRKQDLKAHKRKTVNAKRKSNRNGGESGKIEKADGHDALPEVRCGELARPRDRSRMVIQIP